ncbi:flagellar biosynthesis protein [Oceanicola granulosus HTCC2516]|uniref:Flagellar hook-basal body complex protein FliE n=1 Tax=Oceanicola granulosus (strain ATCC BAA-861 / DSM 15982 / KCTC 12143 / HTCC2516) TaxID=314256 RepID=Q2CGJ0_OCEGH|nr:flagellar hook-basal body complex protein FliE [Oceanicola granulosus]EAR51728.1 flagellar biosynthesis protein [Oceanicola granulosus HTCC2516]
MSDFTSIVSTNAVRGAYRSAQTLNGERPPLAEGQAAKPDSFSSFVQTAATDAVGTVREADAAMKAGVTGEMDTQAVVEATLALESTVKVAVSVRDKVVEAYQQVMQMPI